MVTAKPIDNDTMVTVTLRDKSTGTATSTTYELKSTTTGLAHTLGGLVVIPLPENASARFGTGQARLYATRGDDLGVKIGKICGPGNVCVPNYRTQRWTVVKHKVRTISGGSVSSGSSTPTPQDYQ